MTQAVTNKVSENSLSEPSAATEPVRTHAERVPSLLLGEAGYLTYEQKIAIEREARQMRARALTLMFRRIGRAIERAAWRLRERDIERYLAKSSDLADLERRIRDLERGRGSGLGGLSY